MDIYNLSDNTLLVVPTTIKNKLLLDNKKLKNIKYMTLEEFKKNYFFDYDINTIYYLMKNYNIKYNIAKMYLENMIYTEYNVEKLEIIKKLKKELEDKNLLEYNKTFKEYINKNDIVVYGYFLNKLEYQIFNSYGSKIIMENMMPKLHDVYEFENIDDEYVFVAIKIIELLKQGIDIEKIKICNVGNDELLVKRIFNFFNIPIVFKEPLYKVNMVIDFIESLKKNIPINEALKIITDQNILKYLLNILNELDTDNYNDNLVIEILINTLKNTRILFSNNKKVITCVDIETVDNDDYVFLVGFNQGLIPKIYKDEEYLSDKIKDSIGLDTSITNNIREKEKLKYHINRLKNLVITYRMKSPYEMYVKNVLIDDLKMNVIKNNQNENKYNYSNIYNKLILANDLDNLIKYNKKTKELDLLYNNYKIKYQEYNNKFTGINNNTLMKYINNKLLLSYSSIDNYYRCSFKYYIKNILKLEPYEETFAIFIGNLFHDILSKAFKNNFDFEKEFNDYLKDSSLNTKETFFINKLKEDLLFVIETIKEQNNYSKFNKELYEEKIFVNKDKNIKVTFMGIVDKIRILEEDNKTYIAIIDYKTGSVETKLGYTLHGINMQLPVYLYLVNNTNKLKNVEVVGFYLQKIINGNVKNCNNILEKKKDLLKLDGYSIKNEKLIEKFDISHNDSKVIKGMKTTQKGFYAYSKVLNKEQIKKLISIVDEKIDEASLKIINGEFEINPKRINGNLVGCEFCKYNDICYRKEEDIIDLEEDKNYSFLGSDIND